MQSILTVAVFGEDRPREQICDAFVLYPQCIFR